MDYATYQSQLLGEPASTTIDYRGSSQALTKWSYPPPKVNTSPPTIFQGLLLWNFRDVKRERNAMKF